MDKPLHPYEEAIEFLLAHLVRTADFPTHSRAQSLLEKCMASRASLGDTPPVPTANAPAASAKDAK